MAQTGSLRATFTAFDKNNQRLAAIAAGGGPLEQLVARFHSVETVTRLARQIHRRVVVRLIPHIRKALGESYDISGLGHYTPEKEYKHTGALRRACVDQVRVEANLSGIFIGLATKQPLEVYKKAGALEYGALRNSGAGRRRRPKMKRLAAVVYARSGQVNMGGASYIKPHPFFSIESLELEDLYADFFQDEVDRILKRG